MAGKHSPQELEALLLPLKDKVAGTRREHLAALLPEIEPLAEQLRVELELDEQALDHAKSRYRAEFSFLERINPFDDERRRSHAQEVAPVDQEVQADRALLSRCCELLEWVRNASQAVEWRTCWHGGVYGVYDESTGQAEWRQCWHGGIAGVYHPDLQQVQWRESWKHGVAGVFNPISREIEWRECWHGGVAGVFNPRTREVEWRERWHHGIAGVYDPRSETVEWKEVWKGGVAGAWCPYEEQVLWSDSWHHGVACISFDGSSFHSSGSYYGDEGDD